MVPYKCYRCFKGCAEWKVSGGGSLFEATEPEGCDCDEVTFGELTEEDQETENRWGFSLGGGGWGISFGSDKPQEMSAGYVQKQ